MNKARIAVLAILTLSVINLCLMIPGGFVETRVFPDYSPLIITLFNVFLTMIGLVSIWQVVAGMRGKAMSGKIVLLLAMAYFLVYVADIANIFPRSADPMGQTLFVMEVLGVVLAVLLFISTSWYIKTAPKNAAQQKVPATYIGIGALLMVIIVSYATVAAVG